MSFQYSNPKVAGHIFVQNGANQGISTHSRPKAAGQIIAMFNYCTKVSTHSRLKAAGRQRFFDSGRRLRFNTQPPKGGWDRVRDETLAILPFQHTAA